MGDDRRNVKCAGCGCLVFASAADARCMACKGGVPKNAFAEWREHADDEELFEAVAAYRGATGETAAFGALLDTIAFKEFVIRRIREREGATRPATREEVPA